MEKAWRRAIVETTGKRIRIGAPYAHSPLLDPLLRLPLTSIIRPGLNTSAPAPVTRLCMSLSPVATFDVTNGNKRKNNAAFLEQGVIGVCRFIIPWRACFVVQTYDAAGKYRLDA